MKHVQVPVGYSFHAKPEVIRGKPPRRSAQALRETILTVLYKYQGGPLTLKGLPVLLGYIPNSNTVWRVNKVVKALIEEGYIRRVKGSNHTARYYVLKGVPELDNKVTGAVADTPPRKPVAAEPAPAASFGNVDLSWLLNELIKLNVQFSITISNKGFEDEVK